MMNENLDIDLNNLLTIRVDDMFGLLSLENMDNKENKNKFYNILKKYNILVEKDNELTLYLNWNTKNVKSMTYMFQSWNDLNDIQFGDKWNTFNVKYMNEMFYRCTNFNPTKLSLNTKNVKYMDKMFYGCTNFNPDNLQLNMDNVTNMNKMFSLTRYDFFNSNTIDNMQKQVIKNIERLERERLERERLETLNTGGKRCTQKWKKRHRKQTKRRRKNRGVVK